MLVSLLAAASKGARQADLDVGGKGSVSGRREGATAWWIESVPDILRFQVFSRFWDVILLMMMGSVSCESDAFATLKF
ncbi:hypothetical protein Dimus_035672 [Dionaea muscipula]